MSSKVLGIDLGTTYSCVAYIDQYGKAVVLKNSDGDHTTPSVVMVESEGSTIVGTEAKRSIELEPDKTVQFIKRKMGKDDDTVELNGTTYHAPEISAMILRKIVKDAVDDLRQIGELADGEDIKDVVITCPAYFGMNEKQATITAGKLAGLNVLNIIQEPSAAAISYGVSGNDKNETVLDNDLGVGTFDITVMDINKSNVKVVCTGGDDHLGGKDWDEALINYVVERYEEENGEDLSEDPEAIAALYVDVETWKKSLTNRTKTNMSVKGPAGPFREELTREKYEEITHDLLNRTKNLLDDVIATAEKQGYPISKIDKVLLVGGSSKMPQVAAMIERDYGVTPVLADPDEAVAKGAAIYASSEKAFDKFLQEKAQETGKSVEEIKAENLKTQEFDKEFANLSVVDSGFGGVKINVQNVLSRTYGIAILCDDGNVRIANFLYINKPLPATETKTEYGTSVPNQKSLSLKIYESRSTDKVMDIDREPITVIPMKFNQEVRLGTQVIITLSIDNAGLMHIVAEEQQYHSKLDTTFQLSNQMSDEDMIVATDRMSKISVE